MRLVGVRCLERCAQRAQRRSVPTHACPPCISLRRYVSGNAVTGIERAHVHVSVSVFRSRETWGGSQSYCFIRFVTSAVPPSSNAVFGQVVLQKVTRVFDRANKRRIVVRWANTRVVRPIADISIVKCICTTFEYQRFTTCSHHTSSCANCDATCESPVCHTI